MNTTEMTFADCVRIAQFHTDIKFMYGSKTITAYIFTVLVIREIKTQN